jgi:hypothetical protein
VEQKELQRVEALVEAGASPTVPEPFQQGAPCKKKEKKAT